MLSSYSRTTGLGSSQTAGFSQKREGPDEESPGPSVHNVSRCILGDALMKLSQRGWVPPSLGSSQMAVAGWWIILKMQLGDYCLRQRLVDGALTYGLDLCAEQLGPLWLVAFHDGQPAPLSRGSRKKDINRRGCANIGGGRLPLSRITSVVIGVRFALSSVPEFVRSEVEEYLDFGWGRGSDFGWRRGDAWLSWAAGCGAVVGGCYGDGTEVT